jgi:16S rRNA (uracil1498-N3)-methyltransferase
MDRFFLSPEDWTADELQLAGEEGHHAVRVMRKKTGDSIEVFDGEGRWARGTIKEVERARLVLGLEEEGTSQQLKPSIELAVAIPKGKTMDLLVQKAVELGVSTIQPLATINTVVKVAADEAVEKSRKWQRVALEACKQCGQNFLPEVKTVRPLSHYLREPREGASVIASLAPGAVPVREKLESVAVDCQRVSFLVGPEGDFAKQEIEGALAAGFEPVSLGEIVLRVETAGLFLASAARYRFG